MKRFYAHYTFIYPDIFLKNHIVEQNADGCLTYYPFEKEIADTGFHSGLLVFIPYELKNKISLLDLIKMEPALDGLIDDALVRSFRV